MALGSEKEVAWRQGQSSPGIGRRQEWALRTVEEGISRDRERAEGRVKELEDTGRGLGSSEEVIMRQEPRSRWQGVRLYRTDSGKPWTREAVERGKTPLLTGQIVTIHDSVLSLGRINILEGERSIVHEEAN